MLSEHDSAEADAFPSCFENSWLLPPLAFLPYKRISPCVYVALCRTSGSQRDMEQKHLKKKQNKKRKRGKKKAAMKITKKELLSGMIEEVKQELLKFWVRRLDLFSLFDDGVQCDEQGLYSVTPEEIARHQAETCGSGRVVIDGFAGVGGNAIQFALRLNHVVAIDIDPRRVECAQHNARVYGVAGNIDFILGDFFLLAPSLKADVVFLSPPWGGPKYKEADIYDIETMLQPRNGFILFNLALSVAPSVVLFLPKTVDVEQLAQLAWLSSPPLAYKVQKNYIKGYLKALTVYYGEVACRAAAESPYSEDYALV